MQPKSLQTVGKFSVLGALVGLFFYLLWFRVTLPSQVSDAEGSAPVKGDLFVNTGKDLLQGGFFTEAVHVLQRAVLLQPDSLRIWSRLAKAYEGTGAFAEAILAYEHIVQSDSGHASLVSLSALERLGKLTTRHDMLRKSRQAYESALGRETRPEWLLRIKNQLAELDLTEGHYTDDGNTLYNERGEVIGGVGPGDMRTNRNFEIARHTDDWLKKEIYFKRAIASDPGMYQAYFDVGLALTKQNRFKEAISYFQRSNDVWKTRKDLNPGGLEKHSALAYLGLCYLENGDAQQALDLCDRAIAIDGSDYYGHLFRAKTLLKLSRADEAIDILCTLLLSSPEDREVQSDLVQARNWQGVATP